jgi:hypothetical protein
VKVVGVAAKVGDVLLERHAVAWCPVAVGVAGHTHPRLLVLSLDDSHLSSGGEPNTRQDMGERLAKALNVGNVWPTAAE